MAWCASSATAEPAREGGAEGAETLDPDVLSGFDAGPELEPEEVPDPPAEASLWDLDGDLALAAAYNIKSHRSGTGTRYGGLSMLQVKLNLGLDVLLPRAWRFRGSGFAFYDFSYDVHDDRDYTGEVLDELRWDAEVQDLFVEGTPLPNLDVKIGRQLVDWGRSDNLRVLDIINPIDNRHPGLMDIRDLKRPVGMVKLSYYHDRWSLTGLVIPEVRVDESPPRGSDWFPDVDVGDVVDSLGLDCPIATDPAGRCPVVLEEVLPPRLAGSWTLPEDRPRRWSAHPEWGLALTGIFDDWDVSLYASGFFENTGHPEVEPTATRLDVQDAFEAELGLPPGSCAAPPPRLRDPCRRAAAVPISIPDPVLRFSRLTLVGVGANRVFGSWLLKGELAWLDGLEYDVVEEIEESVAEYIAGTAPVGLSLQRASVETGRIDAMLGVEYNGFQNLSIALEAALRHTLHYRDELEAFPSFLRESQVEYMLRLRRTFLRERLEATAVGIGFGSRLQDGGVLRLELRYEVAEALDVSGGLLLVRSGELPLADSFGSNDRVFLQLTQSF